MTRPIVVAFTESEAEALAYPLAFSPRNREAQQQGREQIRREVDRWERRREERGAFND